MDNKELQLNAIPLRAITAGELRRSGSIIPNANLQNILLTSIIALVGGSDEFHDDPGFEKSVSEDSVDYFLKSSMQLLWRSFTLSVGNE